ncbi:MAG: PHP domain-containing protein [SAR202 cluster bacterium]|nr:PHP domain-containing protein [SAR202 cluster bacterium]
MSRDMIEVDLHLHTTNSDGRLTPTELIKLCHGRGLKVIAVTDHDSTEGLPEALEVSSSTAATHASRRRSRRCATGARTGRARWSTSSGNWA